MQMHFSVPNYTFVIFREWKMTSVRDICGSFLAVLAMAVLYECVKGIHVRSRQKNWELSNTTKLDFITQFVKTCLFLAEFSFAYFVMLIAMTYNTWLFVAVVIGRGMGYYVVTPLIDTSHHSDIQPDSLSIRRKRSPLIQGADI